MSRRFPNIKRGAVLAGCVALVLAACSEEDNPFWWTGGERDPGHVVPDTLWLTAARDTTSEIEVSTGSSPHMMVGRLGGVEAAAYLKYTSLPDSADEVLSATLGLNLDRIYGDPIRIDLHAVTAGESWDDGDIRWDGQPAVDPQALDRSPPLEWTENDTTANPAVLELPPFLVQDWIDDSATNAGIQLRIAANETGEGMARILSGDAVLADTADVQIVNPPLTLEYTSGGQTVTATFGPSQDAYVQTRVAGDPWGSDPAWLGVGGGRPRRTFIAFDLDSLQQALRTGPTFSIARATLVLTPLDDPPDALPYADSLRVTVYPIAADPEWVEGEELPDSLQLESGIITRGDLEVDLVPAEFEIASLVRDWVTGARENGGLAIVSDMETRRLSGIRFASRTAAGRGAGLRLVLTFPPPARPDGDRP
ncbi:MAG: DNRLRE domain-containing protein [Candidatus Eisenbacteria bacterium]|nr:DNRLRE domain-containing protein [Candidatus Eisenbacteria bacterium]